MTAPTYLFGDPRPVDAAFDQTNTTITFNVGDFVIQSGANIAALGTSTVTTSFLGVVQQKKTAGITGARPRLFGNSKDRRTRGNTDGVYEVGRSDTVALNVGALIAPDATTANSFA